MWGRDNCTLAECVCVCLHVCVMEAVWRSSAIFECLNANDVSILAMNVLFFFFPCSSYRRLCRYVCLCVCTWAITFLLLFQQQKPNSSRAWSSMVSSWCGRVGFFWFSFSQGSGVVSSLWIANGKFWIANGKFWMCNQNWDKESLTFFLHSSSQPQLFPHNQPFFCFYPRYTRQCVCFSCCDHSSFEYANCLPGKSMLDISRLSCSVSQQPFLACICKYSLPGCWYQRGFSFLHR